MKIPVFLPLLLILLVTSCFPSQEPQGNLSQSTSDHTDNNPQTNPQPSSTPETQIRENIQPIFDVRLNLEPTEPSSAEVMLLEREIRPEAQQMASERTDGLCSNDEFEVIDVASGAFTTADAEQKAFLYRYCLAGRSFARNGIAVIEGDHVVAHIVYDGGPDYAIGGLSDINQNGLSEIVIATGGTGQGYTVSIINLLELGESLHRIGRLETYTDNCGVGSGQPEIKAHKIYVQPGSTPAFYQDIYEKRECSETANWVETASQQPVTLTADEVTYQRVR